MPGIVNYGRARRSIMNGGGICKRWTTHTTSIHGQLKICYVEKLCCHPTELFPFIIQEIYIFFIFFPFWIEYSLYSYMQFVLCTVFFKFGNTSFFIVWSVILSKCSFIIELSLALLLFNDFLYWMFYMDLWNFGFNKEFERKISIISVFG